MSQRIKVAYLIASLGHGGAENQLLHLLTGLDRGQFAPSLILFSDQGAERALMLVEYVHNLQYMADGLLRSRQRLMRAAAALLKLRDYLRQLKPDILHAILPAACVLGSTAARWAGVPVVICSRRSLVAAYRSSSKLLAWIDHFSTRWADMMLGNSTAVETELLRIDRVPRERVRRIYNGVDVLAFAQAHGDGFRRKLGLDDGRLLLGTVANFFSYKRHIDLVEAASCLAPLYPNVHFVLVGRDEGSLHFIRDQIVQLKLADRFAILAESADTVQIFKALDIYVCTSETEGFSNVLLEAMAAGKPIVATAVGGNPEAVVDGETGILVPPRSPKLLANSIEKLIVNTQLRQQMGGRGRERAVREFSLGAMVRNHERLYLELVSRLR